MRSAEEGEGALNVGPLLADASKTLSLSSQSARVDAELLLAHCLQQPRTWLITHEETEVAPTALAAFRALIARRSAGVPVAYLLGRREFWSLELEVTPAVLIPRPETETLLEAALARIPAGAAWRIADLGTGSGAIALALARERPGCSVVATDSSEEALAVAQRNAARHRLGNIEFRRGGWYAPFAAEKFELIVSNPPYVAVDDPHMAALMYEPRRALVAGESGLADLRVVIEQAPLHLKPHAWLLVEHGATQGAAVRGLFEHSRFADVETVADLAGLPRVSLGQLA